MALLTVTDLTVDYPAPGGGWSVVRGVSFVVEAGETVAVVGESGGGKSATVQAVVGLPPIGSRVGGSICFDGRELLVSGGAQWSAVRGGQIGMVFQDASSALNPTMPVGHQVAEVVARHLGLGRRAAAERAGKSVV